jgi:hypothetical protein
MIWGVPVAAIADPHPLFSPDDGLRELVFKALPPGGYGLVGPVEVLARSPDWFEALLGGPITELGFVGELGLVGPVEAPADPPD